MNTKTMPEYLWADYETLEQRQTYVNRCSKAPSDPEDTRRFTGWFPTPGAGQNPGGRPALTYWGASGNRGFLMGRGGKGAGRPLVDSSGGLMTGLQMLEVDAALRWWPIDGTPCCSRAINLLKCSRHRVSRRVFASLTPPPATQTELPQGLDAFPSGAFVMGVRRLRGLAPAEMQMPNGRPYSLFTRLLTENSWLRHQLLRTADAIADDAGGIRLKYQLLWELGWNEWLPELLESKHSGTVPECMARDYFVLSGRRPIFDRSTWLQDLERLFQGPSAGSLAAEPRFDWAVLSVQGKSDPQEDPALKHRLWTWYFATYAAACVLLWPSMAMRYAARTTPKPEFDSLARRMLPMPEWLAGAVDSLSPLGI